MISYGSFIWWKGTTTGVAQKLLFHLQRVVCLAITGAAKTTPQLALETLLFIPPLNNFIQSEAKITAFRLQSIINMGRPRNHSHSSAIDDLFSYEPILQAPVDKCASSYYFDHRYKVITAYDGEAQADPHTEKWYTDASVTNHGSGYGIYNANRGAESYGFLGNFADVAQAELIAILNCCMEIAQDAENTSPVRIHTDSQHAAKLMSSMKFESKIAIECHNIMTEIAQRRDITLQWIPAHTSIEGNDRADQLAKKGASSPAQGPEPFIPLSEKRCRLICNKWLQKCCKERWQSTNTCSQTRSFILEPSSKLTTQLLDLDKRKLSLTVSMLTGHVRLNAYLKRIGIRDDPDCDYCGRNEETALHFLCNCPTLSIKRKESFGKEILTPTQVINLNINKIYNFVKKSGRFPSLTGNSPSNVIYSQGQMSRNVIVPYDGPDSHNAQ